jgi:choline-sulfatase
MEQTTRRQFLKRAGAGVFGASMMARGIRTAEPAASQPAAARKSSAGKPNILFIMTDQQSATMMSCADNKWLRTPAMDSLMNKGMRFEKAYATNPVCSPSRFSLFTGHYPSAVGMRENARSQGTEPFVPLAMGHAFRAAGYETVYGGKVHLPGKLADITACGFDLLTRNERDELAEKSAAFLKQPHDRPFLLVASFINPHDICFQAIAAHAQQGGGGKGNPAVQAMRQAEKLPPGVSEEKFYQTLCPPLPNNFEPTEGEPKGIPAGLAERPFKPWVRKNWGENQWRLHRWTYCRLTEMVDRQIGIVLEAFRAAGLEDNTIVIFTADHGDMDASHRMEHKSWTYEQAARIPLMIQCPPLTRPGLVDEQHLVSNGLDLLPTLCDLAGVNPPAGLPGRSLKGLLGGEKGEEPLSWRKDLMIQTQFSYGVTDGRYKYTLFDSAGPEELLCDLQTDPGEMKNLAGKKEHSEVLQRMRKALAEQAAAHNVHLPYDVPGQ